MAVFDKIKGIGVASGFKLQAKSALDPRSVVDTIIERDELVTGNGAYEGMSVYVKENKKTYQLQGTTTADWVDITSEASSTTALENEIKTARGDENTLGERLDFMYAATQTKQNKFTVGNGLTLPFDENVLSLVLDPAEDNALTNSSTGLKVVVPEGKDYTVTVDTTTTTDGMAKSYTFKQLGKDIVTVDIPKDMVVSSGEVKNLETKPDDFPESQTFTAGMYIILTIANSTASKLYIPATGLVDVYTGGDTVTIETIVGEGNAILSNIKTGSIDKTLLTKNLQNEINNKVNKTDYAATDGTAGIVSPNPTSFIVSDSGVLSIVDVGDTMIAERTEGGILTPADINKVVKAAFTDANKITMTDDEKATARGVIGAVDSETMNGAINVVRSEIETASYEKTANKVTMTLDGTFAEGTYPTVASLQTILSDLNTKIGNISTTLNGVQLKSNIVATIDDSGNTDYTTDNYPSVNAIINVMYSLDQSISSKIDSSNIATTIDSSSTDKKVASAKAVYTEVLTLNGNIDQVGTTATLAQQTAEAAQTTADSKVSVTWVDKGGSVPTTATANSLCFRIL